MPSLTAQVPPSAFKEVMANVCAPVSVVTALHGNRAHGTTVSALAALSLDPPMIMVALDHSSELLAIIRASRKFGVNVLGSGHQHLARQFATKGHGKFDGVPWTAHTGVPRITGTPGWLACSLESLVPGGDHVIALGTVTAAETADHPPLTYYAREFGTHSATPRC
jgi:flavin reductase (DIM6/NTAB) family NADH-FMN oxidoreductase RutF